MWWGAYLPLRGAGYDFTGPYEAAYALAHHATYHLYDVAEQRAYNTAVLHLPDGPSDFRWPPPMAALLIPLGLLPYPVAHLIWWLLNQVALFLSLALLARCIVAAAPQLRKVEAPRTSLLSFAALFCAAAWCQGLTDGLRLGQSTPLMLLGLALLAYADLHERPLLAGCGLGLATLEKLFPAVLVLYFLWRGKYRLCLASLGFLVTLVVLTLPITGVGLYPQFVAAVGSYSDQPNAGPVNLSLLHAVIVGLAALVQHAQTEPTGGPFRLVGLLCSVLPLGVFLLAQGRPVFASPRRHLGDVVAQAAGPESQFFAFSWAVVALLLLGPITWVFYYLLLLIPLAWLLLRVSLLWGSKRRDGGTLPLAVGMICYLLATVPLPLDSRTAPAMSAAYVLGVCLRPFALLGIWLSLLRMHVVMQAERRSPVIETAAALSADDVPSVVPAEKRRHLR
jgi:hypothetical protein